MSPINDKTWEVLVLTLKYIAEEKEIRQETIAERTGFTQSNISRIFALKYCPTLQTFLTIANAMDVNFFIQDRDNKSELNKIFEKAMTDIGRRQNKLPKS
ncbi:MAG: helix-turn-helix transcriptional regulator [Candidatus Methanofastidiosa archaeon]|nr:helix-turn-helix transcriptional regulator [Candidatus Methanofastidiosa archaeon]